MAPSQPLGWSVKRYLKSSIRTAPSVKLGEVKDLVTLRRSVASDEVHLVVTVEMNLVGLIADLPALFEFVHNVRIARSGDEGWEPIEPRYDHVLHLSAGTLPGQRMIAGTRKPPSNAVPLPPAKVSGHRRAK